MLLKELSECKSGEITSIGTFRNFGLLVEKSILGEKTLIIRGKKDYKADMSSSPVGNMVKLENLFNKIPENIDFLKSKIEQYRNDLNASKQEYEKPFAHAQELENMIKRQNELNTELGFDNAEIEKKDIKEREDDIIKTRR